MNVVYVMVVALQMAHVTVMVMWPTVPVIVLVVLLKMIVVYVMAMAGLALKHLLMLRIAVMSILLDFNL